MNRGVIRQHTFLMRRLNQIGLWAIGLDKPKK